MERWHNLSKEEVLKALESGSYGLSEEQAGERLNKYGRNESLFRLGLFTNPWLLGGIGLPVGLQLVIIYLPIFQGLFYTVPLGWDDWGVVLLVAGSILVAEEIRKAAAPRIFGRGKL